VKIVLSGNFDTSVTETLVKVIDEELSRAK
jgi:hypothetical protein